MLKTEYEAKIFELELRVSPATPPEVKQQRQEDIQIALNKIANLVATGSKLLEDSIDAWTNLQENPNIKHIQEVAGQKQVELEQVKSGSQALAPMQKILKVTSLQKEIEECRRTEECLA